MNPGTTTRADTEQIDSYTFQADPTQSLSETVIEAVAAFSGLTLEEAADELEPLYYTIDSEALDSLFDRSADSGRVSFRYLEYRLTADATGQISIETC